ncbi:MAG: N-acetylgalactosamine-6-sulfatase [Planctomycetaceae bacterium]|nr:N-acetylgalactosamine-6-sulfatase [Planctomycetaceae bacterium]
MNQKSALLLLLLVIPYSVEAREPLDKPNIIFIMADDLGYGDLGCYGQREIKTPVLDQMARQGIQFRNFYAGCTVCASSRSVLMTGQHMGHTWVRGNAGGDPSVQTLRKNDVTVAERLKAAGYTTALCGKWGLGDDFPGNTGLPNDQGFDFFYGYLNQVHAHNYYPEFLWRNKQKEMLRNVVQGSGRAYAGFEGGWATKRVDYSHDLVVQEAIEFIERSKNEPFFLYLALTIPHANNEGTRGTGDGQEVPDYGIYKDKDWKNQDKGQAAMITRMDRDIGRLNDLLKKLGIEKNTLVLFTSDNGHHNEGGHNTATFDPNGPLRGMKRDLYEGGIRVPLISYWPGMMPQGAISDYIGYFGDLMATACDLAGVEAPANVDSVSMVPVLTGKHGKQLDHKYLYWEFYEQGSKQAVREGRWKAIRMPMFTGPIQLFDLSNDLGEANNVAAEHPEVVKRMEAYMKQAHVPNKNWAPRGGVRKNQPVPGDGKPRF